VQLQGGIEEEVASGEACWEATPVGESARRGWRWCQERPATTGVFGVIGGRAGPEEIKSKWRRISGQSLVGEHRRRKRPAASWKQRRRSGGGAASSSQRGERHGERELWSIREKEGEMSEGGRRARV
jgi:hypothetical protein